MDPNLQGLYPGISYLREAAQRRIPHFAWEYLDSGTGFEVGVRRNRDALDRIVLTPKFLTGHVVPELQTELFGRTWDAPLGVAPVGLAGLMWPNAEVMLARAARAAGLPYSLSMVACETPESVAVAADGNGWFQFYTIADKAIEADILARAWNSGFATLLVTIDLPINSTRERQRRGGFTNSDGLSARRLYHMLTRPAWARALLIHGKPKLRTVEKYVANGSVAAILAFTESQSMGAIDADHLKRLRDGWKGNFVVKGVLDADTAGYCAQIGADGVVVSNHGARQFDAAPASIDALPSIAAAVGDRMAVLFDSGVRTGLDILRALALGADFVLAGRAFMYGVCVAGEAGGAHAAELLTADLANNMMQIGAARIDELRAFARGSG